MNDFFKIGLAGLILLLVLASCNDYSLSEDQQHRFVRYYPAGYSYDSEGFDLVQTSDGGYLITGTASSGNEASSHTDIIIIKTDEYGREETWSPALAGTTGDDFGYDLVMTEDGLIIAGSSETDGKISGYIIKMNHSGQPVWTQTFDNHQEQAFYEINACEDGEFILTGYTIGASGDKQVCLLKINQSGDLIWEREIGFTGYDDIGESVIEYNNRFLIAGTSSPTGSVSEASRIMIFNTNSSGKGITQISLGEENNLTGKDILVNEKERIIILGTQENTVTGSSALYLLEISLEGSSNEIIRIINSNTIDYPESLHGESMIGIGSNLLAICGYQEKKNDQNILFALINTDLQLEEIRLFGETGYQSGNGIAQTTDGGYILTGGIELAGSKIVALIKLGPDGKL